MLVIDSDPVLPADNVIREAIEKLAGNLSKSGVSVARQSPLLPDFAEFVAALHADAAGVSRRVLAAASDRGRAGRGRPVSGRRQEPGRGATARHDAKSSRLDARQWRTRRAARAMARAVQDLRRGDLPDHADAGLSARSFAHNRMPAASRSTARTTPIPINWRGPASLRFPACLQRRSQPAFRRTACRSACRSSAPGWRIARP